jgi:hypothetical protein
LITKPRASNRYYYPCSKTVVEGKKPLTKIAKQRSSKLPLVSFLVQLLTVFKTKQKLRNNSIQKQKPKKKKKNKKNRCSWSLSQEHQTGSIHPAKQQ